MKVMTMNIPNSEIKKNTSAHCSNLYFSSYISFLIETNESREEIVKGSAMIDVNSSMRLFSVLFVRWREVITKSQNPSKFAEVPKICCEVLFDMDRNYGKLLILSTVCFGI